MPSIFLAEVGEASSEEASRAACLGHKLQTGDDGHKPTLPPHTSGVSIITPKVNIPSSFDVQFGRVSDAGERGAVFCFACSSCRVTP